jgi:hypothetical protein
MRETCTSGSVRAPGSNPRGYSTKPRAARARVLCSAVGRRWRGRPTSSDCAAELRAAPGPVAAPLATAWVPSAGSALLAACRSVICVSGESGKATEWRGGTLRPARSSAAPSRDVGAARWRGGDAEDSAGVHAARGLSEHGPEGVATPDGAGRRGESSVNRVSGESGQAPGAAARRARRARAARPARAAGDEATRRAGGGRPGRARRRS